MGVVTRTLSRLRRGQSGELLRGTSVAVLVKAIAAILNVVLTLTLARVLGAEGTGIFFLAFTCVTVAAVVGCLGLGNTVVRFVASNMAVGDWSIIRGAVRKAAVIALSGTCAAALILGFGATFLAEHVFEEQEARAPLIWSALAVVPLGLTLIVAQMLKGLKKVAHAVMLESAVIPAGACVGVFAFGHTFGVTGAVWGLITASVAAAAIGYVLWCRGTPRDRGSPIAFPARILLRSSIPLFVVSVMQLVLHWAPVFLLGVLGTAEDVGVYAVAHRTALLISVILLAANTIAAPKFAELYRLNDVKNLRAAALHVAVLAILLATPIAAVMITYPRTILNIFGAGFGTGYMALIILAIGQFVNVATGSVGMLLIMTGHEKDFRNCTVIAGGLCLSLNILLIPTYGITGAAIATAGSVVALNLLALAYTFKRLGFTPWHVTSRTQLTDRPAPPARPPR